MKNQFVGLHADFIGFFASLVCAIHCALFPILLTLMPFVGLSFLENEWFEYGLILLSFLLAMYALSGGFKLHKKPHPICCTVAGFVLIGVGHVFGTESTEIILTSTGAVSIAIAHLLNWKLVRNSNINLS